jgi:FkbM family methyltransferase
MGSQKFRRHTNAGQPELMTRILKSIVRRVFGSLGYEIQPISTQPTDAFVQQQRILGADKPLMIFDVGAHHGESVRQYRMLFPAATICSFEPFPDSFAKLQKVITNLSNVRSFNVALADRVGEAEFNANQYSATNSLLTTAPDVENVWPGGQVDTRERIRVPTTTLDAFCREHSIDTIDLLKLDVQGAEPRVLKGGEETLRQGKVRLLYTEILTLPAYQGQISFEEFLRMMREYGFDLFNVFNPSITAAGRLRQLDAIFVATGTPPGRAAPAGSSA